MIEIFVLDEKDIDGQTVAPLDVQSEVMTKFVAIELLFPYEMRLSAKEQIEKEETTTYEVSGYFDIPEHLVQFALSDRYMDFSKSVWDQIN